MLVYEGIKKEFLNSVEMDTIAEEIENTILEKMGRHKKCTRQRERN